MHKSKLVVCVVLLLVSPVRGCITVGKDPITVGEDVVETECPGTPIDFFLVIDESQSVGQTNFDKQLDFLSQFAAELEGDHQYAAMKFSSLDRQETVFDLLPKADASSRLTSISYNRGTTYLEEALIYARDTFLTANQANDVTRDKNIVLIITDGESVTSAKAPANDIRNLGIPIITIGVSGYDINQLREISTYEPIIAKTFDDLDAGLRKIVGDQACRPVPNDLFLE